MVTAVVGDVKLIVLDGVLAVLLHHFHRLAFVVAPCAAPRGVDGDEVGSVEARAVAGVGHHGEGHLEGTAEGECGLVGGLAATLVEGSVCKAVPAVIVAAAPDVCHLHAVVAVALQVAIVELVGIELNVLAVCLDGVDAHDGVGIGCGVAHEVEHVYHAAGTGVLGVEGHLVLFQSCCAAQHVDGG